MEDALTMNLLFGSERCARQSSDQRLGFGRRNAQRPARDRLDQSECNPSSGQETFARYVAAVRLARRWHYSLRGPGQAFENVGRDRKPIRHMP